MIINDNGKRPQFGYDRVADARLRQSIPKHEVKQSKKTPGQQRGLAWLDKQSKVRFEAHFASILAQRGVKETHEVLFLQG